MFKRLLGNVGGIIKGNAESFDPSKFNDHIAIRTEWSPLKSGGASFCTQTLIIVNSDRIQFRISFMGLFFSLFFLFGGFLIIFRGYYDFFAERITQTNSRMMVFSICSSIFCSIGAYLLYSLSEPIVFDKKQGYFWKGRKEPMPSFELKGVIKLEEIHAIQLIPELCSGDKKNYYSYELNLVLKDGKRINVTDHGSLGIIRSQTKTISEFLEIPVWDVSTRLRQR
jgi:hypothetical protein